MSSPITWRNVNAPTGASEAAALLQGAGASMNGAFSTFDKVIKQREANQALNVDVQNELQKQGYLDVLEGARTPEQLAALQPQIAEMRAGLTAANRAATRGADDARLTSLRQGVVAANAFADTERARVEDPIRDEITSLIAAGNTEAARALLDKHNLRNEAALVTAAQGADRLKVTQGREDASAAHTEALRPFALTSAVNTQKTQELNLAAAQQSAVDTAANRQLSTLASAAAASHQRTVQDARVALGAKAKELGLPVDSDGYPKVSAYEQKDIEKLNAAGSAVGLPPVSILTGGDTSARNNFVDSLRKTGTYTPQQIATLEANLPTMFSTVPGNEIGNDAQATAVRSARVEALSKENASRFTKMDAPGERDKTWEALDPFIKTLANGSGARQESYNRQVAELLQSGGIPVADSSGKVTRILPGIEAMKDILRSTKADWSFGIGALGRGGYENDLKDKFTEWANKAENQEAAKAFLADADTARVKQILNAALKPEEVKKNSK